MKQKWVVSLLGAASLALCANSVFAAGPLTATQAKCSDTIQNETIKIISAIQKQIKTSIKNNRNGKDSICSGGLACAGGKANGKACTSNAHCSAQNTKLGDGAAQTECTTNLAKGIAGAINNAKAALRKNITAKCNDLTLGTNVGTLLGFPTARCQDYNGAPFTTSDLADCILQGAIGDIPNAIFGDPAGEIMGRAAGTMIPYTTFPNKSCGVTLGSILQIGSKSSDLDPAEAGGAAPLTLTNCSGSSCDTEGSTLIGNRLTAPTDSNTVSVCLWTSTTDAGNGTTQMGTLDLSNGDQTSFAPISTEVYGGKCPKCNASKKCEAGKLDPPASNPGPNNGKPCTNIGATDLACPPGSTVQATIPNPLDLTTGSKTLTIPLDGSPGVSNPAGAFCGKCAGATTIGCQNDSECGLDGPCSFGSNVGAFGDTQATEVVAVGHPGPIMPRLAGVFCTGSADNGGTIDTNTGLPGPVRLVQQQLNAFEYP